MTILNRINREIVQLQYNAMLEANDLADNLIGAQTHSANVMDAYKEYGNSRKLPIYGTAVSGAEILSQYSMGYTDAANINLAGEAVDTGAGILIGSAVGGFLGFLAGLGASTLIELGVDPFADDALESDLIKQFGFDDRVEMLNKENLRHIIGRLNTGAAITVDTFEPSKMGYITEQIYLDDFIRYANADSSRHHRFSGTVSSVLEEFGINSSSP